MNNDNDSENKIFIKKIVEASLNGELVYFIGSGFSKSVNKNNKTWSNLIAELAKELNTRETDYLKVAQMYYDNFGQIQLKKKLQNNIYSSIDNTNIIDNLFSTNPIMIFTTNWDNIFENYINDKHLILWKTIVKDKDIIELRQNDKLLVKVHGDLINDNFVFTEDSYMQYDKRFKLIRNLIINVLATRTIVFLGYSFSDPDIKQIIKFFDEEELKQLDMYYVNTSVPNEKDTKEINGFEKNYLTKYGLKVIDYKNSSNRLNDFYDKFFSETRIVNSIIENIEKDNKYYNSNDYIYINHIYDVFEHNRLPVEVLFDDGIVLYFMFPMNNDEGCNLFYEDLIKNCDAKEKDRYILKKDSIYYEYFSKMMVNYLYFEKNHKVIIIEVNDRFNDSFYDFISYNDKKEKFYKFAYGKRFKNTEDEYIIKKAEWIYNKINKRIVDIKNINNEKSDDLKRKYEIDSIKSLMSYIDKKHIYVIEKLMDLTDVNELYMKINEKIQEEIKKNKNKSWISYSKFDPLSIFASKIYSIVCFSKYYYYPIERYREFKKTIRIFLELCFENTKANKKIVFDRFLSYLMINYLTSDDIELLINKKEIKCDEKSLQWIENTINNLKHLIDKDTVNDNFYLLETYSKYLMNIIYISSFVNNEKLYNGITDTFIKLLTSSLPTNNHIKIINHYFEYQLRKFKNKCDEKKFRNLIDILISKIIGDGRITSNVNELREIKGNRLYSIFNIAEEGNFSYNNELLTKKLIEQISLALRNNKSDFYDIHSVTQFFLLQLYYVSSVELQITIKEFYLNFIEFVRKRMKIELHDLDIYISLSAEFNDSIIQFDEIYNIITDNLTISTIVYDIRNALKFYKEKKKSKLNDVDNLQIDKCIKKIDEFIKRLEESGIRFR